jgi:hypothetical protein
MGRRATGRNRGARGDEVFLIFERALNAMNHDTIVDDWRKNAEAHDAENYEFLRSLKFGSYGFRPDDLASELHQRAFQIVDCTRCANCCKTMNVIFTKADVRRIAGHLGMPKAEFIDKYLEVDERNGAFKARGKPCPFLGDDDRCTIYEVRPKACQEYPHTDKKGFTGRTLGVSGNALVCPAVFWIIEQMKQRALKRHR